MLRHSSERALASLGRQLRCPWRTRLPAPVWCVPSHAAAASSLPSRAAAGSARAAASDRPAQASHDDADVFLAEADGAGDAQGPMAPAAGRAGAGPPVPLVAGVPSVREFDLRQSFHKFPFRREVQLGILKMGVAVPTRVQDLTIPKILDGLSVFMLAQTGTGKTLAYVLPLVHQLLQTNSDGFFPLSKKPRLVIVQPTRELAMQTIKIIRNFPVRSAVCAPGNSFIKESQALHSGVDVVVGTPFRLILHLGKENMFLSQVRHIVLDEADTLCDTFYEKDSTKILKGLREDCKAKPQIIIVGATRTGAVSLFLRKNLNDTAVVPVVTSDAHMTPPQVEQVFVPTRGRRLMACLMEVFSEVPAVGRKTLIFTNRVPTCRGVHQGMLEHGINAVALHGGLPPKKRKQVWADFNGSAADVMVCTNLASRGIDFSNVHHVIMYNFPLNLADYLHRVGRTARGGKAGRVTTITPKRYWPFVTKIQEAAKSGRPIEVRHATKNMKKILAIETYQKVAQQHNFTRLQRQAWRRRLGLPPARNIGTKETKMAMKHLERRVRSIKHMRFLQKQGVLRKGHGIPQMPDQRVEASETQTASTLVRARDGLLQVIPKRRRVAEPIDVRGKPDVVLQGDQGESKGMKRRRSRTVM